MFWQILFPAMLLLGSCDDAHPKRLVVRDVHDAIRSDQLSEKIISDIAVPQGYQRLEATNGSFAAYLHDTRLLKDKTVYLYNGQPKTNQDVQYAVLDISVGNKDLQQCADAVMRLRAEYFYSKGNYTAIIFKAVDGTIIRFSDWLHGTRFRSCGNKLCTYHTQNKSQGRTAFDQYLEVVFSYCSTLSLPYSLISKNIKNIEVGDVFLKPGTPGHALIVMAVAVNTNGGRAFMLAQSYMPAQSIHILKNPNHENSPWYYVSDIKDTMQTPEWEFTKEQLYGWR